MKPVNEMWDEFAFEIDTDATFRAMEEWLDARYPEAKWHVSKSDYGVSVSVEFNTPKELSFYMLKWS